MKERYCSLELSKLLKENGFNEKTLAYYDDDILCNGFWFEWNRSPMGQTAAPTHQMAMDWLREKHQLHISVDVSPIYGKVKDEKGRNTCDLLYWHYMASGEWMNDKYNPQQKAFVVSEKSHKKAVEAALEYCLIKLI